ncbi:hypothetical protein TRFO_40386 [Tritrichomonas foetus]|uniref:RAVE complex protein Rav1 C-terminal domain-containing protein n=1 Tax=Tritrichomonas foetus TaxID=1144522 RepID=A0A1J4J153_9EUKA|nr:hypothetical protein TRFO_40386 [Tritrichomonas foetus]|eukprot:OHS93334.1 hypothetical protein TRFO_40386 [Tritrichomonas foetus]
MSFPLHIESKLINPGYGNDHYPYCISYTYFQGQQIIAYGSANKVIIVSNNLSIIASLTEHEQGSSVTAVAWAPYSGRLSSCGSDLKMNLWEPVKNGWRHLLTYSIASQASCISWNLSDTKFCIAANEFTLYDFEHFVEKKDHTLDVFNPFEHQDRSNDFSSSEKFNLVEKIPNKNNYKLRHFLSENKKNQYIIQPILIDKSPIKYCAFSVDSRFILTLKENGREIYIWYRKSSAKNDYRCLVLKHPSDVISISWRLSEDVYERCSFMSIAKDGVVRIWMETGVNEPLSFNVAASIPSNSKIVSGCFLITTSKMISNNPSHFSSNKKHRIIGNYANGSGHLRINDRNSRYAAVPDPREIKRNRSWLMCFDTNQNMSIWELSGLSLSVRKTPKFTLLGKVSIPQIPAKGHNLFFATCRLESELSHLENPDFEGRPSMISLIFQSSKMHTITTADIIMGRTSPVSILGMLKGHRWKVKFIRIHEKEPIMMTIDEKGVATIWRCDDTDVFDPSVFISFLCTINCTILAADFIQSSNQVLSFNGKSLFVFDLIPKPLPIYKPNLVQIHSNFKYSGEIIDFRILCEFSEKLFFVALFSDVLYIGILEKGDVKHVLVKKAKNDQEFISGSVINIYKSLPICGSPLYIVSTKKSISVVILDDDKGKVSISEGFDVNMDDEIVCVSNSRPSSVFIITIKFIYVVKQIGSKIGHIEVLEKYELQSTPLSSCCLSNGLLAVVFENEIQLFFRGRESHEFTQSGLNLYKVCSCPVKNVSSIEWTVNGILIYSSEGQIFALTKFMDTFFLNVKQKLPTIHHSLVHLKLSVPDLHSTEFIPLIISGRFNLVSKMIKYLDNNFDENDLNTRLFFMKYVLTMPSETDNDGNHLISKSLNTHILSLKTKLENEYKNIYNSEPKVLSFEKYQTIHAKGVENRRLLYILNNLKAVMDISFDVLDQVGLTYLRAVVFSQNANIPFDLIACALLSHEKAKILELINVKSWETIDRCGIVFWSDLKTLEDIIVPIVIKEFPMHRHISIFFLVLFKRFRALHHLFTTDGDDTRAAFFIRDFKNAHNRKSALNNGFSALSKQDFHIAAAMFMLAGSWENALKICVTHIKSHSILYLVAQFCDDKKLSQSLIDEYLLKAAKDCNDLAALAVFKHITYGERLDLVERMQQTYPGFLYSSSRAFGDTRFCVCEVFRPSIDNITDVANALTLSGHFLLAIQLLPHLNVFVLTQNESTNMTASRSYQLKELVKNKHSSFTNLQCRSKKNDYDNDNSLKMSTSMSLNNKANLIKILKTKIRVNKTPNSQQTIDDSYSSEEINDEKLANIKNKIKALEEEEEEEYHEVENIDSILGLGGNYVDDFSDYISDSEEDNDETRMKNNDKTNKCHSNEINIDDSIRYENEQNESSEQEESQLISFYTIMTTFNVARLRLEMFIERTLKLSEIEAIIPPLTNEIQKAGPHIASMMPQLQDYMIRSCKRCSFVLRRFLLLSDPRQRYEYIVSLCNSLITLPNHIASHNLTPQQIAQVSLTLRGMVKSTTTHLFVSYPNFRFVMAAIATGIFIVGYYTHNAMLILSLLQLDLKSLKEFTQDFMQMIKVDVVSPENVPYNAKRIEIIHHSVKFLSKENKDIFSYKNVDKKCLSLFMSSLLDMLLIDEFVRQVSACSGRNAPEFQKLLGSLKKMHDLYIQLFTYNTLNFPVILKIASLNDIEISNPSISSLYKYLLGKYDRIKLIPMFCKNILMRFSDLRPHNIATVAETSSIKKPVRVARFKGGISSFIIVDDKIIAATGNGFRETKVDDPVIDAETENGEFFTIPFGDIEYSSSNQISNDNTTDENGVHATQSISLNSLDLHYENEAPFNFDIIEEENEISPDTMPSFKRQNDFKPPKHPVIIEPHPTERYALIADVHGRVYAKLYDDDKSVALFRTPDKKCTAIDFGMGGTMFGAAHENIVSLYSMCTNDSSRPFAKFNTFGSFVSSLKFIQGSGIFATCQMPTHDFDANIVFWDSVLPPGSAMIASLKVDKIGRPCSMCFSPKYNELIVGTGKGAIIVIDTRKYEIVTIRKKMHERGIYALSVDQNESYCVTGGGEGSVKIWDMRSLELFGELNNVHSARTLKYRQKWRSFSVTNIRMKGDLIYTSGIDGEINRIVFS